VHLDSGTSPFCLPFLMDAYTCATGVRFGFRDVVSVSSLKSRLVQCIFMGSVVLFGPGIVNGVQNNIESKDIGDG